MTDAKPEPVASADSQFYWQAAAEGRLVLQQCAHCGHLDFMPRHVCPQCWSENRTWVDAAGTGTVHSFSVVHRAPLPAFRADVPYVVALIELAEGPRMLTNIVGDNALSVEIGSAVTLCFEDRGAAKVPQFRLAEGGA
ncbi:MAG: Zn-ribbon domain-containing OB-fold protein [Rhodospirillaceae bacterium]